MKVPRGQVRKLILALGDIQDLVGTALSNAQNDRSIGAFEREINALEKAFQICVDMRGEYAPVERKGKAEDGE